MKRSHLEYFKSLIEGTAEISWNAWFAAHEEELQTELPRAEFLRLKFLKLEKAEEYLKRAQLTYRKDPVAFRREKHYANLDASVLDERGRPIESFQRQAYDGAVGLIMDGDVDGAAAILDRYVRKLRRYPMQRRREGLEDLCYDGEMELDAGDPAIGRVLLEAVASFPKGNDLTDFAVERSQDLLARLDREKSDLD